jgi:hypothetical protein
MITPDPIAGVVRNAKRNRRHSEAYGTDKPACALCGVTDPAVIVIPAAKGARSVIEQHHVAGHAASDLTLPLCRNHHEIATERLRTCGVPMSYADRGPSLPEIIGALLTGLGALLHMAADVMIELGAWITTYGAELVKQLRDTGVDLEKLAVGIARVEPLPWFLRSS